MKKLYNTVLLFFILVDVFAQTANISGRIVYSKKQIPVAYGSVYLENSSFQSSADGNGFYKIENVPLGEYKFSATALGYASKTQIINLVSSADITINFTLDSVTLDLDEVEVKDRKQNIGISRLRAIDGMGIYEGKKTEVIVLKDVDANLAINNSRQIFAKVPGITIWESDAAGAQVGIAARGLSPNRSAEFNMRQNGYDMSADALGYPESYYSPPTEAVEKIEIVRGAASLQYGTQFGGMVNYVMKKGARITPIEIVNRNTVGSYGLFTSYNSIGGRYKKINYFTFYQYKTGNGWRPNTNFNIHTGYASIIYQATPRLSISTDITAMNYLMQQPGGLTDREFIENPQQSKRERNWFQVTWNLASISLDYKLNEFDKINIRNFGFIGTRNSLGHLGTIDRQDNTNQSRDLIMDNYFNWGSEGRYLNDYKIGGNHHQLLVGYRFYRGLTYKRQGYGSNAKNADFTFNNPTNLENSDFRFPGTNAAIFAENIFNIHERLSITPGFRYEYLETKSDGYYRTFPTADRASLNPNDTAKYFESRTNTRHFPLFGMGLCFVPRAGMEIYANISQNYRGITFTDIRVASPNVRIDPNIKDESGYNADIGWRGTFSDFLSWDVSAFYLFYKDRIGFEIRETPDGLNSFRYRTNISNSRSMGLESFAEINFLRAFKADPKYGDLSVFQSLGFVDARYIDSPNRNIENNFVEFAPMLNSRSGITYKWKKLSSTVLYSFTSQQYTDVTNSTIPNSWATLGSIPSYGVLDLSVNFTHKWLLLSGGVNNVLNQYYFTRRATSYPGPGIVPAEPRIFYITAGVKF